MFESREEQSSWGQRFIELQDLKFASTSVNGNILQQIDFPSSEGEIAKLSLESLILAQDERLRRA
jgi:hypothetical protein